MKKTTNLNTHKVLITLILLLQMAFFSVQGQDFEWANQMGASSVDVGKSIKIDNQGNIYATGSFSGTVDFDPSGGVYNLTAASGADVFISKLNSTGALIWAKSLQGNSGVDEGASIALDNNGHVYITGYYQTTVDFDPNGGVFNLTSAGNTQDIFVLKLDTAGNFIWAKSMGGIMIDRGLSIAVDTMGNVFSTGYFQSISDFDPGAGTLSLTSSGGSDIFISKLDDSGNFIWAKSMGSTSSDIGRGIATDIDGNVYTTGSFNGTVDFDPNAGIFNHTSTGSTDMFINKLDVSGQLVWTKSIGGVTFDYSNAIELDAIGNFYITGIFGGPVDFDPNAGVTTLNALGTADIFVSKFDTSGMFVWAKNMGSGSSNMSNALAIDIAGNVYTTGYFQGTMDFDPGSGTSDLVSAGAQDIFINKLDMLGNFVWAKGMGNSGFDEGTSIAVDSIGNVYGVGYFFGIVDFDPNQGVANLTSAGNSDIFIIKLASCNIDNSVIQNSTTLTANTSNATYQWLNCTNNTPINGETNQSYTATANGDYAVIITVGACSDTSACVNITGVSINELEMEGISLYPNPTSDFVTLEIAQNFDVATIELLNVLGQSFWTKTVNDSKNNIALPKETGVYFVKVNINGQTGVYKVLKQ